MAHRRFCRHSKLTQLPNWALIFGVNSLCLFRWEKVMWCLTTLSYDHPFIWSVMLSLDSTKLKIQNFYMVATREGPVISDDYRHGDVSYMFVNETTSEVDLQMLSCGLITTSWSALMDLNCCLMRTEVHWSFSIYCYNCCVVWTSRIYIDLICIWSRLCCRIFVEHTRN